MNNEPDPTPHNPAKPDELAAMSDYELSEYIHKCNESIAYLQDHVGEAETEKYRRSIK